MISYDALWKTLEEKGLSQYKLIFQHGISTSFLHRLRTNQHTNTSSLERLCQILDCNICDIVNFVPDIEEVELPKANLDFVADSATYQAKKKL